MSLEFKYGKAPIYYVDGVPGYKAGEWPGLKSNKFGNTRRIINPMDSGIIFNEKEKLPPPRRKLLGPGPSPEYQFRPCLKMVTQDFERYNKPQGIRVVNQEFTPSRLEPERRHRFRYLEERAKEDKENERKLTISNYVKNEMKLMEVGGGFVRNSNTITNKQLYKMNFIKKGGLIRLETEPDFFNIKQRERERKKDMNYVSNLNKWESNILKKYEIKPKEPTVNESIKEEQ